MRECDSLNVTHLRFQADKPVYFYSVVFPNPEGNI